MNTSLLKTGSQSQGYGASSDHPLSEEGKGSFPFYSSINDGETEAAKTKSYYIQSYILPGICTLLACIVIVSVITPALIFSNSRIQKRNESKECSSSCSYQIVESMPLGLDLALLPGTNYTYNAWADIISQASSKLTIVCFYSSLINDAGVVSGGEMGNNTFNSIVAAIKRGVKVTIVQNQASPEFPDDDTRALEKMGAELVSIDWKKAFTGGILHTKAIAVDGKHFYVGSANLDWRSLAQVKELGVKVTNCECLTQDIEKIMEVYYTLGKNMNSSTTDFTGWPESTFTSINQFTRLSVPFENEPNKTAVSSVFMSASPRLINEPIRTNDIDALVAVINNATQFIYISVMDFQPLMLYDGPMTYWSEIEDALKQAILRNVNVKLLISKWDHTKSYQYTVLQSLSVFGSRFCGESKRCTGSISVKMFQVPDQPNAPKYPFTRVNHAKYMVTEQQAYISTSNWSKDYFYTTAGISFTCTTPSLRQTVEGIFNRDYSSQYASDLPAPTMENQYSSLE